jgi:hypothetical protein
MRLRNVVRAVAYGVLFGICAVFGLVLGVMFAVLTK